MPSPGRPKGPGCPGRPGWLLRGRHRPYSDCCRHPRPGARTEGTRSSCWPFCDRLRGYQHQISAPDGGRASSPCPSKWSTVTAVNCEVVTGQDRAGERGRSRVKGETNLGSSDLEMTESEALEIHTRELKQHGACGMRAGSRALESLAGNDSSGTQSETGQAA